jgi:hypothetical protein
MHQYITGHCSASEYDMRGRQTDHQLRIHPDGSFTWTMRRAGGRTIRSGAIRPARHSQLSSGRASARKSSAGSATVSHLTDRRRIALRYSARSMP